jgi:hypothetical protein
MFSGFSRIGRKSKQAVAEEGMEMSHEICFAKRRTWPHCFVQVVRHVSKGEMLEGTTILAWVLMIRRSSQQRVMTRCRVVIGRVLCGQIKGCVRGRRGDGRGCISGGPSNSDILVSHHGKRVDEKRVGTTIHLLNRYGICIKRSLVDGLVGEACQSRSYAAAAYRPYCG